MSGTDIMNGVDGSYYVATQWKSMACGCLGCQMASGYVMGPFSKEDAETQLLALHDPTPLDEFSELYGSS